MNRQRLFLTLLAAALAMVLAFLSDPWVWRNVAYPGVYEHDWGRMLRVMGSLVLWVPLALAVGLEAGFRRAQHASRTWLLVVAPTVAGGIAELLKLLIRRERPGLHDGAYLYRGFADRTFDTHDIGFPSSHVMVAFAGAAVLARWYPKAGAIVYLLALGCAVTRLLAQAHFASDVVAGGVAGWAIGTWLGRRWAPLARPVMS
jgi:membrane-associated phospholipid phosphatase